MASNWGRNSRGLAVEGRSIAGTANPLGLPAPVDCGDDWALNLALPIDGNNDVYALPCAATGGAQAQSDVLTIRRASVSPVDPVAVGAGQLMIQSSRIQGEIFEGVTIPGTFSVATSATHRLIVTSYYVSPSSALIADVPTLRRHRLIADDVTGPRIVDEEVAPGVENLQIQLGVDIDQDNTVDRYTARIWLVVRGVNFEAGLQDGRDYEPGNVDLGVKTDNFRRLQVSKTILLRNART